MRQRSKGSCEKGERAAEAQDHRAITSRGLSHEECRTGLYQDGTGALVTCIFQPGEQGDMRQRSKGSCQRGARAAEARDHRALTSRVLPHEDCRTGLCQDGMGAVFTCISQSDVAGNPAALTGSARGHQNHRQVAVVHSPVRIEIPWFVMLKSHVGHSGPHKTTNTTRAILDHRRQLIQLQDN
jgi:hypothetical protein